jgi:hypothetical protein
MANYCRAGIKSLHGTPPQPLGSNAQILITIFRKNLSLKMYLTAPYQTVGVILNISSAMMTVKFKF